MQICFPSEEELVKVPKEHGRKYAIVLFPAICLNPEVNRTDIKTVCRAVLGSSTSMASPAEF